MVDAYLEMVGEEDLPEQCCDEESWFYTRSSLGLVSSLTRSAPNRQERYWSRCEGILAGVLEGTGMMRSSWSPIKEVVDSVEADRLLRQSIGCEVRNNYGSGTKQSLQSP